MSAARSPRIERVEWGSVLLEGGGHYKDVKLFPGGARAWDWGETGTRHAPGIQPADVRELVDRGAEAVVLSRGQLGRLEVAAETVRVLEDEGVEVHVHETREAVEVYNRLAESAPVGALIHSTC
jgi:hypothetical protein